MEGDRDKGDHDPCYLSCTASNLDLPVRRKSHAYEPTCFRKTETSVLPRTEMILIDAFGTGYPAGTILDINCCLRFNVAPIVLHQHSRMALLAPTLRMHFASNVAVRIGISWPSTEAKTAWSGVGRHMLCQNAFSPWSWYRWRLEEIYLDHTLALLNLGILLVEFGYLNQGSCKRGAVPCKAASSMLPCHRSGSGLQG